MNADFFSDDMGEAGLTQSRRPVKQDVVDGFAAAFSGLNGYLEVFLGGFLADKVGERTRAEVIFEGRVFYIGLTGNNASDGFILPEKDRFIMSPEALFSTFTLPQGGVIFTSIQSAY
jgi:hypothetical protein